ncbi:MAG: orotidine-5'-phosphate decarboxylase [Actinomycetes bacterium]
MSSPAAPFGKRLADAMAARGPLCVGVDPHDGLLEKWGLEVGVDGLREFSLRVVETLAPHVAVLKPQSAFFERHGSRGIAVLEETIAAARAAGALVIVDAKRGDIGSTVQAYATAYLDPASPLAGDAVTASPFLGYGSLRPLLDTAAAHGNGVFVLALTSTPEGAQVQHAREAKGESVAAASARHAAADNPGADPLGSVGLVVGATLGDAVAAAGVDLAAVNGPFLAPGIGAQGAGPEDLRRVIGTALSGLLPSVSREVLGAGPEANGLRAAFERTRDACAAALGR